MEDGAAATTSGVRVPSKRTPDRPAGAPPAKRPRGRPQALVVTKEEYERGMRWVKLHRPRVLEPCCKVDIVALQLHMRHQRHKNRRASKGDVTREVAKVLARKTQLCGEVWKSYVEKSSVTPPPPATSRGRTPCKIKYTSTLRSDIQLYLQERNAQNKRTVCRDIVRFLVDKKNLPSAVLETERSRKSAVELVRRFLQRHGFVRGSVKGNKTYREKEHIVRQRNIYVSNMVNAITSKRVVYLDESYVDLADEVPSPRNRTHEGRCCFIGALLSADPSKKPEDLEAGDQAELMLDMLDMFGGGMKQTKDNHDMLNHEYFVAWMQKLLDALATRGITDAVIVMDNAKYHKVMPESCPKKSWAKAKMAQYAQEHGIQVDPQALKDVMWQELKPIADKTLPVICEMAKQAGHQVWFSPPHYPDLQPMELVWAIVKGEVGRQYDDSGSFEIILERVRAAFDRFGSVNAAGLITKSETRLRELYESEVQQEEVDEDEDDKDNEDFECDSDVASQSSSEGDDSDEASIGSDDE